MPAWFRIGQFWVTRAHEERRPVWGRMSTFNVPCAGGDQPPTVSGPPGLKRSQAQQGEPVRMALAGHQLPRALALALGVPAAQEAAVVQEEPQ